MADATSPLRWHHRAALRRPTMIAAFTGWNDAGDAASKAMRHLIETWQATALAEVDAEEFTDFATVRPLVHLDDQHHRSIVWPTVGMWHASPPGGDVILVLGPEPALRWRAFCSTIVQVAEEYETPLLITLGALLADVPHTRPVRVIGTAADDALIERFDLQHSRYEGPTGIVGVLHDAFINAGIPGASLWAAVPGYAAHVASPPASAALLERAAQMVGTPPPTATLRAASPAYEHQVSALIADDVDMLSYVARLESMYDDGDLDADLDPDFDDDTDGPEDELDDQVDTDDTDEVSPAAGLTDGALTDGALTADHDLVAEVERFLRDQER